METEPTTAELIETIRGIVGDRATVNLGGHDFDRVPCSRRRIYAICRKHASEWGYRYEMAEYVASGNPAFKRNHKRGRNTPPYMFRMGV